VSTDPPGGAAGPDPVRGDGRRAVSAGLVAALVGFASSFAVVLHGLRAVGASEAQAASGLMALSVAMGLCAILLSLRTRMPVSVAWSTPGAALLAGAGVPHTPDAFPAAVGAFLLAAALTVAAGLIPPLGRAVAAIPGPLASAMLAGVLLPLCLAPVHAVVELPVAGGAIVAVWVLVGLLSPRYATPAAAAAALVAIWFTTRGAPRHPVLGPAPVLTVPHWSAQVVLGVGVPLFLVTMAAQNVPGIAVLRTYGYRPHLPPLLRWTGLFSLLGAPFGGHAVNLAAITAALCAGDEAGTDPRGRYRAAAVSGVAYLLFGLAAGAVVSFVGEGRPVLIEAVAGLALLGALGSALHGAVARPPVRAAAMVTLVVTASGVSLAGIGGAFWGLAAGGALHLLPRCARLVRAV
jgi:benzoate membrane transport protein